MSLLGSGWRTQEKAEGISLVHLNLLGHSQGQAEKCSCGGDHLVTVVHLVTWMGCSSSLYVRMLRRQETKFYNTTFLSFFFFFGLDFLYCPDPFGVQMFKSDLCGL